MKTIFFIFTVLLILTGCGTQSETQNEKNL